jgi:hypothetical protein
MRYIALISLCLVLISGPMTLGVLLSAYLIEERPIILKKALRMGRIIFLISLFIFGLLLVHSNYVKL